MFRPLDNNAARSAIDAFQLYEALQETGSELSRLSGGMHWKTVTGGREYLYRTLDRLGNAKSLGPRSLETEAIHASFHARKAELSERRAALSNRLSMQEKINAVYRAGTAPSHVADICLRLSSASLLGSNLHVVGTNSIFAYESLAGVRFDSELLETTDLDLLWDHSTKLQLVGDEAIDEGGLITLLKKVDPSFSLSKNQPFRAVSKSGFMVDLIRATPVPPWKDEPDRFFENDFIATDIVEVKWLVSAPKLRQLVVSIDGRVFPMHVPDPRAFAMYKLWMSQSPTREPIKRGRDFSQAKAVIQIIQERLPHLSANWRAMRSFPAEILEKTLETISPPREA